MKLICFTSAKGGVGTSYSVACLSALLAQQGKQTLCIDLHSGMRTLDVYLGVDGDFVFDINDAIDGECSVDDAVVHCDTNLDFIACSQTRKFDMLNTKNIYDFVEKEFADYDYVLADCPSAFAGTEFFDNCNNVIVVTNCDTASVRCTEKLCNDICGGTRVKLLINNILPDVVAGLVHHNADDICDLCGAAPIGLIPCEPAALILNAKQIINDKSLLIASAFANTAQRLQNNTVCAVDFNYKSYMNKLLKKYSRR